MCKSGIERIFAVVTSSLRDCCNDRGGYADETILEDAYIYQLRAQLVSPYTTHLLLKMLTLNQVNPLLGCLNFPLVHLLSHVIGHGHGSTVMAAKYSF